MSNSGFNGKRLKAIRERNAWSVKDFLKELNSRMGYENGRITKRYMTRWEAEGKAPRNPDIIQCFAAILDCETEDFFDDIELLHDNKICEHQKRRPDSFFSKYLRDFSGFINERNKDFIGRNFVFNEIDKFVRKNDRGYFFIIGDPGIGKSSIAAKLASRGYIHHFNIRVDGRNNPRQFLENVCSRLILDYRLPYEDLVPSKIKDGELISELLKETSNKLMQNQNIIIVIDALDEVNEAAMPSGVNTLYLPMNLPIGVYIIATTRPKRLNLRIECEQSSYTIDPKASENRKDICKYIRFKCKNDGIRSYIKKQKLSQKSFIEYMKEKSEGNFMYLHYVLPEIEKGAYQDRKIEKLPDGLHNYYEDHWSRMGMYNHEAAKEKLAIIYTLSEICEPLPTGLLSKYSGVGLVTVQRVIDEWLQFLHIHEESNMKMYAVYHSTFREFLKKKEIVQASGVSLADIHSRIADHLLEKFRYIQ